MQVPPGLAPQQAVLGNVDAEPDPQRQVLPAHVFGFRCSWRCRNSCRSRRSPRRSRCHSRPTRFRTGSGPGPACNRRYSNRCCRRPCCRQLLHTARSRPGLRSCSGSCRTAARRLAGRMWPMATRVCSSPRRHFSVSQNCPGSAAAAVTTDQRGRTERPRSVVIHDGVVTGPLCRAVGSAAFLRRTVACRTTSPADAAAAFGCAAGYRRRWQHC